MENVNVEQAPEQRTVESGGFGPQAHIIVSADGMIHLRFFSETVHAAVPFDRVAGRAFGEQILAAADRCDEIQVEIDELLAESSEALAPEEVN